MFFHLDESKIVFSLLCNLHQFLFSQTILFLLQKLQKKLLKQYTYLEWVFHYLDETIISFFIFIGPGVSILKDINKLLIIKLCNIHIYSIQNWKTKNISTATFKKKHTYTHIFNIILIANFVLFIHSYNKNIHHYGSYKHQNLNNNKINKKTSYKYLI